MNLNPKKLQQTKVNYCSPSNTKYKYTCFSKNALINISNKYNLHHPNNPINIKASKKNIYDELQNRFKSICDDEHCWLKQTDNLSVEKKYFIPTKPCEWYKNPNTWLNSLDIENVIKQYQELYNDFHFLGIFPIDFQEKNSLGQCISQELCNLDINKFIKSKQTKLGAVFNLDKHNEPGSHWVALYICLDETNSNFGVHYYDSVANPIPKEIKKFMLHIKKYITTKNKSTKNSLKFKLKQNIYQHQYKNTECGVYSMHFLLECLKDTKSDIIYKTIIKDDEIAKFRDIYFKPNKSCSLK
jgi:hypothetical protein